MRYLWVRDSELAPKVILHCLLAFGYGVLPYLLSEVAPVWRTVEGLNHTAWENFQCITILDGTPVPFGAAIPNFEKVRPKGANVRFPITLAVVSKHQYPHLHLGVDED